MKKILFLFLISVVALKSYAQPATSQPVLVVSNMADLTSYAGTQTQANWTDSLRGGKFNLIDTAGRVVDNGVIFASGLPNKYWMRDMGQASVFNVRWWGAKGDYKVVGNTGTDNWAALTAAIKTIPTVVASTQYVSPTLFFPEGSYYISDTLSPRSAITFQGDGGRATDLYWPSGKNGFILNRFNTPFGHTGLFGQADGCWFINLGFNQIAPIVSGNAIVAHCAPQVIGCRFSNWGGCGIYINAGAVSTSLYHKVHNVMMNVDGTGYTSPPTVTISGDGTGAQGHAVLASGVQSVTVIDSGRAYYSPPSVFIGKTGGTLITEDSVFALGYGAAATAQMGLDTIMPVNTGSGYTTATVTITGSTGPFVPDPAICDANVNSGGQITSIDVLYGGSGYNTGTGTNVVITSSTGSGATATATVVSGVITAVTVTDEGDNYTDADVQVDITGSSVRPNATATAVISGGSVVGYVITKRGTGYATAAAANISVSGDGTGATATATLQVVHVTITNKGGLFESNPVINFRGGRHNTGHDAAAYGVLFTTQGVKRVIIDSQGVNYTTATIAFTGGGGSGALGTVVLWGERLGNANRAKVTNCGFQSCSYGIWTEGSDVNAGVFENNNFTSCRHYAVVEGSFLGNLWKGNITQLNQGSYMATSNTGYNTMFLNDYSEGNQLPAVGVWPARLYGGDHGAGIVAGWNNVDGQLNFIAAAPNNTTTFSFGGLAQSNNGAVGELASYYNSTLTTSLANRTYLDQFSGDYHMNYGNTSSGSTTNPIFNVQGPYTANTFGRSVGQPYTMYINGLRIGSTIANGRVITNASAQPSSGEFAQGDLIINRTPTSGSSIFGWLRLTNGTNNVAGVDWMALISASGSLTTITATNNYAQTWTITNPTSSPNLSLVLDTTLFATRLWTASQYPTASSTTTLTNKAITKRVTSITSSTTPTPNISTTDDYVITALATTAIFGAPTGSPTDMQELIIRIKDNGTPQLLSFNAIYRFSSDLPVPNITITSKTLYMKFIFNNTDTRWDCVAYITNF